MWYRGDAIYEFGHGLSYTTFSYEWVDADEDYQQVSLSALKWSHKDPFASSERKLEEADAYLYKVKVTNTGHTTGDAVVLGFVTGGDGCTQPLKKLFDFDRVANLNPGESATVVLTVPMDVLSTFAHDDDLVEDCYRAGGSMFRTELRVEVGDILNPAKTFLNLVGS